MMKKPFIVFLVSLFVVGCNNEQDSIVDSSVNSPFYLGNITIENSKTKTVSTVTTGTVDISTLDANGAISLNGQYTYSNSKWNLASSTPLKALPATPVCAYYPYNSGITDRKSIPLTSGLYSAATDLSYGYATTTQVGTTSTTTASFQLMRAYARLTFNFSCGAMVTDFNSISTVTVDNPGIVSSSTLDITSTTGTYGTATKASVTVNPGLTISANTTQSVALLMVPTDALVSTGNIVLTLTGGSPSLTKTINIPVSYFPNSKLEAGKDYTFNIDLNKAVPTQPESNCYMVTPGSTIYIPVSRAVAGNASIGYVRTGGGTTAFSAGDTFTAGILWSDIAVNDVTVTVFDKYIKVTAGATEGNFVVYAMKGTSIVWSWHIWVSNYMPSDTTTPNIPSVINGTGTIPYYGGQYWMDRNLGATSSAGNNQKSMGLYYQWGRKDPFPAASGVTSTTGQTIYLPQNITYPSGATTITNENTNVVKIGITSSVTTSNQSAYSIQYPLMFLTDWAGSTASIDADATTEAGGIYSWCTGDNKKTIFDPCPVGWRVPTNTSYAASPWNSFGSSGNAYISGTSAWNSSLIGMSVTSPAAAATFFPGAGLREYTTGVLNYISTWGNYWAGSVNNYWSGSANYGVSTRLAFSSPSSPNAQNVIYVCDVGMFRAYGFSVRCVQE